MIPFHTRTLIGKNHFLGLCTKNETVIWIVIQILAINIFFISTTFAQTSQLPSKDNFDLSTHSGRAQLIIEAVAKQGVEYGFWGGGKYGAYPAMAQFAVGNVELGRQFAREQLTGSGAMFREFGNMALYMKYGHLYDQELKDMVKDNQLHHSALYAPDERGKLPGASENHKLMYAAANYLGGLAWPDEYPKDWFRAGYDYLMYWFDEVTDTGFWEEDSPTYFVHHLGPILSVFEFAPDTSQMKRRAKMVYEWYLASTAGEYLKGYWITSAARDYVPVHGFHLSEESIGALWLYFGDTDDRIPNPAPTEGHPPFIHWLCAVHMATSDYSPPELLVKIATDRDEPFVHKEYMYRNPMHPKEYAFINRVYGLASILNEGNNIPADMTRWKLQWIPEQKEMEPSVFLLNHPKPDEDGWKNWQGASPYEKVLQHEGTLIALYKISENDVHPFIDGPLANDVYRHIIQKDGWWFFHTGEVLFGVYAANGLYKTGEKRLAYRHYGDDIETDVLRSDGTKNAIIIQTALRENFSGSTVQEELEHFSDSVINNSRINVNLETSNPSIEFITYQGDKLNFQYDEQPEINSKKVDFEDWPMLGNPWMQQALQGQYLTLKHDGMEIIYDYDNWQYKH